MSKLRDTHYDVSETIDGPEERDLAPYVVFTRLSPTGPFIYAGWLDAADESMAEQFAREHYGQDQKCLRMWIIPRTVIAGTDHEYPTSDTAGGERTWQVFTQKARGDGHRSGAVVTAASSAAALAAAKDTIDKAVFSIWIAPQDAIISTDEDDLIWRHTDQTYRLARGYSKSVRAKWERVRAERDLVEYEKEDLHETF